MDVKKVLDDSSGLITTNV